MPPQKKRYCVPDSCGTCGRITHSETHTDTRIECENEDCLQHFHMACQGIDDRLDVADIDHFFCMVCKNENPQKFKLSYFPSGVEKLGLEEETVENNETRPTAAPAPSADVPMMPENKSLSPVPSSHDIPSSSSSSAQANSEPAVRISPAAVAHSQSRVTVPSRVPGSPVGSLTLLPVKGKLSVNLNANKKRPRSLDLQKIKPKVVGRSALATVRRGMRVNSSGASPPGLDQASSSAREMSEEPVFSPAVSANEISQQSSGNADPAPAPLQNPAAESAPMETCVDLPPVRRTSVTIDMAQLQDAFGGPMSDDSSDEEDEDTSQDATPLPVQLNESPPEETDQPRQESPIPESASVSVAHLEGMLKMLSGRPGQTGPTAQRDVAPSVQLNSDQTSPATTAELIGADSRAQPMDTSNGFDENLIIQITDDFLNEPHIVDGFRIASEFCPDMKREDIIAHMRDPQLQRECLRAVRLVRSAARAGDRE